MKLGFLMVTCAALTGCVSVADVRSKPPVFTGSSDKPTDQIAACVATSMQKGAGILVTSTPIDGGLSVIASAQAPQGITPFTIVDIVAQGTRREMSIRINGRRPKDPTATFSNLVACL